MKRPKVCILRTAGTNCDKETAFAFESCKAIADLVHVNQLKDKMRRLSDYQILSLPGGFSYGDDIAAGKILANELKYKLIDDIRDFVNSGKLIIGICNGFQVLVKAGLLPGNPSLEQEATLGTNDSGEFEDRWVYLKSTVHSPQSIVKCVWVRGLPEIIYLPVAHGEGKFITKDDAVLERLRKNNQIVFQYCDSEGRLAAYPHNPNGSQENIAGVCDETGRILGLMPHPERHSLGWQNPFWMRKGLKKQGDGLRIFRNGVKYAQRYL